MTMDDTIMEKNTEAINESHAGGLLQDGYHEEVMRRVEQTIHDRGKGDVTVYSGARQDDLPSQVDGPMRSEENTSPKCTKKLRTERDIVITRDRTCSKTRANKTHSDAPSI